jgi:hypothetical protein
MFTRIERLSLEHRLAPGPAGVGSGGENIMKTFTFSRSGGRVYAAFVAFATALGLVIGLSGGAQAADYCTYGGIFTFVAKGFHLPAKGKCKPVAGFVQNLVTQDTTVFSGTACTAQNGSRADFSLAMLGQSAGLSIVLPGGAGTGSFTYVDVDGSTTTEAWATGGPCNAGNYN